MIETLRSPATTESAETAFPFKLHIVLDESEKQGFDDIISWQGNNAFIVHKPKKFEESIMKEFFNQTLYRSFQKQCKFLSTVDISVFSAELVGVLYLQLYAFFRSHQILVLYIYLPKTSIQQQINAQRIE